MTHFTDTDALLEDLKWFVFEHPNCKASLDDDEAARVVGFRVETEEGESQTWVIGAEDLKATLEGVRGTPRRRELLRQYILSPLGRQGLMESLEKAAKPYWVAARLKERVEGILRG